MTWRARGVAALIGAVLFSSIAAALPPASAPLIAPSLAAASGETLTSPRYVSAAVMPNGQVGLLFQNNGSETRFKRYTSEQSTDPSIQLATSAPAYPQLATFKGELVAAYVGTASKLAFRISTDSGATWGSESFPFGTTTFATDTGFAPVVVTSKDQQSLYVFTATNGSVPQYRLSTDATLVTWSSAAAAGDSSMRVAAGNNCGSAGNECYRAHAFQFTETASAGRWLYIAKSDAGYGQSGRGTQYGTLGGSWSTQIDLGGSGGLSGGGESTATTFLDRAGNLVYVRAGERGENVYVERSTDNGASWGPRLYAYAPNVAQYVTGSPVGLDVPGYSQSEYVWWAGFGGTEDTVRVDGLWSDPRGYGDSGTARLFGSNGGDWDAGLAYADTFGLSHPAASTGSGVYTTSATDLSLPGRLLPLSFTRTYTSADLTPGPLGLGWTHAYNWKLTEFGTGVQIRRGDGRRDVFNRNTDGSYAPPVGVYSVLVKHTDGSFTLTEPNQVQYEFIGASGYPAAVGANSPGVYWRLGDGSGTSAADASGHGLTGTYGGTVALGLPGALHDQATAVGFNGAGTVSASVTTDGSLAQGVTASCGQNDGATLTVGSTHGAGSTSCSIFHGTGQANDGVHDVAGNYLAFNSTNPPNNWYEVDLGSARSVGAVRYWWNCDGSASGCGSSSPPSGSIAYSTSTDGVTYTVVATSSPVYEDSGVVAFTAISARYVRMTQTTAACSGCGLYVVEFEVYGPSSARTVGIPGGSAARTIEAWVRPTGNGGPILTTTTVGGQEFDLFTEQSGGTYWLFVDSINSANGITLSGAEIPPVGAWSHMAFVFDGSANTWHYYLNGVSTKSGTFAATINTAATTSLVAGGRTSTGERFSGSLEEVALYPAALSAAQIAAHYEASANRIGLLARIHEPAGNQITLAYAGTNLTTITDTVGRQLTLTYDCQNHLASLSDPSGRTITYRYDALGRLAAARDAKANTTAPQYRATVQADAPTAYWPLDDPTGAGLAADEGAGPCLPGTVTSGSQGAAALTGESTAAAFDTQGSGYIDAGDGPKLAPTSTMSVELWLKANTTQATLYPYILSKYNGGSTGWALGLDTGHPYLWIDNAEASYTGIDLRDNAVHHLVGTYDGSNIRLYLDGTLRATQAHTGWPTNVNFPVRIGAYASGAYKFTGVVDEVALYPSVLSATRINAHYTAGTATAVAGSWRYAYDGSSQHLLTVTDPDGRVAVTNTYDSSGRLATQKDGRLKQTSFSYGTSTTTVTDPRSHATTFTFDARQRLLSVADTVGSNSYTLQYSYDTSGNRTDAIDREGNRTDYTYDTAGNLLTKTDPQLDPYTTRTVTTYTYDSKHNVLTVTDPRSFVTTNTYDSSSSVLLSTSSQIDSTTSAKTTFTYGDSANPGLVTKIVSPRGNTTSTPDDTYAQTFSYDSTANRTQRIDADGAKTTWTYDTLGRQLTMVDPDGYATGAVAADHTWSTAHDQNDRVTSSTDPLGNVTSSTYDGAGNTTSATDPNGNVTAYTYDATSRLATVVQQPDPSGHPTLTYTTSITRDDNGNATSVTQANGVVTDYAFDALNRTTSTTTHPTSSTTLATSYVLNGNGQPTTKTLGDGTAITYSYDTNARLTAVAASGLTTITYGYDAMGDRTSMVDGTGTTTYSYDGLGRLTQAAQPNGTTTYGYDRDSNRTTLGYPTVGNVTYTYSAGGRLSGLTDWASHTAANTYTASGQAATVTAPGGLTTTYTYDPAHRLTEVLNKVGSATITDHAYTLDYAGNRTALDEFVSGITTGTFDTFDYTYDGLERLTAGTTTNPESFTLDAGSNIASRTGPSATNTYDTSNRMTSDGTNTFTWSNADRLTARGSDSFSYDPLDRLTSSTVSTTTRTYGYNGDGLLATRTQSGTTTNLLWDPTSSPSRLLQVGSDRIVYGLGPLYVVKSGGSTLAFARDGGKSVRAEISGSGTVTASFRYRAYGAIVQSSGASTPSYLGYAGQLQDPSGLLYMRARWYDPATGRFLTLDPLATAQDEPRALNGYGYGDASPLVMSDATGTMAAASDESAGCVRNRCNADFFHRLFGPATDAITTWLENRPKKTQEEQQRSERTDAMLQVALIGMGDIGGGIGTIEEVLSGAERWLGSGYREFRPGIFRSADDATQFRMTPRDLAGTHGDLGPHVHFEALGPNGEVIENAHVKLR
jgi:RHS repeat-associated protein